MNKLITTGAAVALVLGSVMPVFAHGGGGWWHHRSSDTAVVINSATATSNTGTNSQNNTSIAQGALNDSDVKGDGARSMTTGNANANARAVVVANTHVGCGPCASGGHGHRDTALVGNEAGADANTGDNWQDDTANAHGWANDSTVDQDGTSNMRTGNANSRARALTVVNTHVGGYYPL